MAVAILARLTASDLLRQGSTWLVAGLGIVLLGLSLVFGMFNFAEAQLFQIDDATERAAPKVSFT